MLQQYTAPILYVLNSLINKCNTVKNYQVRRINDTTYLVTCYPEIDCLDFESQIVPVNDKRYTAFVNTWREPTTITVGEKPKHKPPSASFITKVRENYFRHFFATKKTPTPTDVDNMYDAFSLDRNLQKARRLASLLKAEVPKDVIQNSEVKILRKRGKRPF
ncbi:unnamed protein product [Pieris macdunnoughi]|uniref:Uncharacterized protein n=1 Tax=Pieris macdunnoughi TaxID=345717 RepID=A0A821SAR9_9NEOP|nr:unnamed protein product [Pieris macdunnoughi]